MLAIRGVAPAVLLLLMSCGGSVETFNVRLSAAPIIGADRDTLAGVGSATAVLTGSSLVIEGSFEHLASPATVARLHIGPLTGVRGDVIDDLDVTPGENSDPPGTSGTISGSVELTPDQVEALRNGRLYIQLHSEGAPDGHLLGWLLEPKEDA